MNNEKKNLIFLWNYLEWGGAQIYILAIIKSAVKNWNVKIILPRKSSDDILRFIEEIGAEYEFIDVWTDNSPAFDLLKKIKRQWRRIHAEIFSFWFVLKYPRRQTIFHIDIAPWQSWIFLMLLALRGNVFVTVHNALGKTSYWRETIWKMRLKFLSKLDGFHIFTANNEAKESLKPFVSSKFYENIKVTYASINPLEIEEVLNLVSTKLDILNQQNLPVGKFIVLCAGHFIDRKGRWIFLEAAEKISQIDSDMIFVWLMPELPDKKESEKISTYNLKGKFYPILSSHVGKRRQNILEFLNIADIFVLPSYLEGLPISLLESMALKKACISSNINGIPEAVKHLETGWLINSGSSEELFAAIRTLKNDESLKRRLAENARNFVCKKFDEREMAKTAILEYENCFK